MKFFAIIIAMISFMAPQIASGQSHKQVDRPIPVVGKKLTYEIIADGRNGLVTNRITNEIVAVDGDQVTILSTSRSGSFRTIETLEMNTIKQFSQDGAVTRVFTPHSGYYKFPLTVGSSYEVRSVQENSRYHITNSLIATVVGWDEVHVPAGTFVALKIVWEGTFETRSFSGSEGGVARAETTNWYVPNVGIVKEILRESYWRKQSEWANERIAQLAHTQ